MDFSQRLLSACNALGVALSEVQQEKLLRYIAQLQRWNKTYNLTALRDPEQMLIQHIFDSLSVVPALTRYMEQQKKESLRIVDVGAGAGLPGVVLAVASSTWNITCVDAVEKKMAFVRQMSAVLELPNLTATHRRVEVGDCYEADVVISRAFASLTDFVTLAGRHVSAQGCIMAMKGKQPEEEINQLEQETDWVVETIEALDVPELDAQRCLVYLKRKGS